MSEPVTLRTKLDLLHARYVREINTAIGAGRDGDAGALADDYDRAALSVVAAHEGREDLLPWLWERRLRDRRRAA